MLNLFQGFEKKLFGLWRTFSGSYLFNEHHKRCCTEIREYLREPCPKSEKSLKVLRFGLWRVFAGLKRLIAWLCIILSYEGLFVRSSICDTHAEIDNSAL